jgi:hypothetical protein
MQIPKYTFGVGDRFGHQGRAQLKAFLVAREQGIDVYPVWNKSNREHSLIGSSPDDVRTEARNAVESLGWKGAYFVDADHINLKTVDRFIVASNFFTLDVAEDVGKPSSLQVTEQFIASVRPHLGMLKIPGIPEPFVITPEIAAIAADKFLFAIRTAGRIYRHVELQKGPGRFVTEISVDETDTPQTPAELFLILAMIANEKIPVQTIAPKFTGRFNKGVDYTGDLGQFEKEFEEDLHVLAFAVREFGLPPNLKLSVHSGSDKFSLYPIIRKLIQKHDVGLHVKTAGTTWLEELVGLAEAGGEGLAIAKEISIGAMGRLIELTEPYASVIDIDVRKLPSIGEVSAWSSDQFVKALQHDSKCPDYNPHFRQLLHVSFKLAAKMGARYAEALVANQPIIERNVKANLWERHIQPIFG